MGATMDAVLKPLTEALVRRLMPLEGALSSGSGMRRSYPFGCSHVKMSPRIFRMDPPTQIVGGLRSPVGLTSLAIFKTHFGICSVCLVRFVPSDAILKTPRFLFLPVVINITICGDWAGSAYDNGGFPGTCADAVADPSNYDRTNFPLFPPTVPTQTSLTEALIRINSISVYQKC